MPQEIIYTPTAQINHIISNWKHIRHIRHETNIKILLTTRLSPEEKILIRQSQPEILILRNIDWEIQPEEYILINRDENNNSIYVKQHLLSVLEYTDTGFKISETNFTTNYKAKSDVYLSNIKRQFRPFGTRQFIDIEYQISYPNSTVELIHREIGIYAFLSINIDAERLKNKNFTNKRIKPNFKLIDETRNLQILIKTQRIPETMVTKVIKNSYPLNSLDQIERNKIYRHTIKLSKLWEDNLNNRIFYINPIEWEFTLSDGRTEKYKTPP